ncbi:ribonucleoside-diphosphate reductase subunit alpha [Spirulina major]|uniref:ribonucleoside-diphosphate reductase subunit alpha n=1 Tax=Spirulina major TaxID=270636 RepID=UPI0009327E55|nr:ribonucleoside-diphosphate reductase subunit alpha [Spirulina major]
MQPTHDTTTLITPVQPNISVIKRDGTTAPLNIKRIRDVVLWACEGFEVNSVALESGLKTRLRHGVTTREIQDNLINCALEMCSPEEPDWRYVAGRLHIWSLWKDTLVARHYQYDNYPQTVNVQITANAYDDRILTYTPDELAQAGNWINPDYDLDYDYAGAVMLTKRYLLPNELPQEALLTCALLIASVEEHHNRMVWARRIYEAIASRKISLATPILANLRVPGGSLASCFITAMEDNLESIFHEITNTARISKGGGGVGMNVSRIRATGSRVMGKENASGGVLPWVKLLNDTAIAVNQGGRRAGAVTVSLDIWHLDIPEFLECQTENGDVRRKAYDVFPQIVIVDEFMQRVKTKQDWTLVDPYEVNRVLGFELAELWGDRFDSAYAEVEQACEDGRLKLFHRVNARELFKEAMRTQVETGLPYMSFKDTINRLNPNKHEGYIPATNLCVESFSNVKPGKLAHTCNLVSLNLANIDDDLAHHCETSVRILDNTIDLTNAPFDASGAHNDRYRTIGVGAMGLADWLAKRRLKYGDRTEISTLFENMGYHCTRYSMELAQERGAYPAFEGSEWSRGNVLGGRDLDWINANATQPERWHQLARDIQTHGIRNSHVTAIAPNTSSSLVQGCTASILPTYSKFYYDKWAKGVVPIAPPFISDRFWFYTENKVMDQRIVVDAVATIQQWIDTGISMELLFNLNEGVYHDGVLTAKDIYETLVHAWEQGCKAIYYIRTVQKDNYKESDTCVACAN